MNGGLRLACTAERMIELRRQATTARSFGLEMHLLSPAEAKDLWPLMDASDLVGAAFLPTDGQANPSDITQALAKGARQQGVRIVEDCAVTGFRIERRPDRRRASPSRARSRCEVVALCAGQWSKALGRLAGVRVPLQLGAAPVHDHRADRGRDARPADAARPRPPDLLQGGGRRPGDGRLRAGPEALGRGRHSRRLPLHAARSRLGPLRAADGSRRSRACRRSRARASSS